MCVIYPSLLAVFDGLDAKVKNDLNKTLPISRTDTMAARHISYHEARALMQPGDVIAFGGSSAFSKIIKLVTFSNVSHVGIILKTQIKDDNNGLFFNQIIESTGKDGVSVSRFSKVLDDYDGEVWWLPLSDHIRHSEFDLTAFFDFLYNQAESDVDYDLSQALTSAVDVVEKLMFGQAELGHNQEDFSKFFCSELVAAGLEKSQAVDTINASEVTPIDLCRWNIYQNNYYILKGDRKKTISRFNSTQPKAWNKQRDDATEVI